MLPAGRAHSSFLLTPEELSGPPEAQSEEKIDCDKFGAKRGQKSYILPAKTLLRAETRRPKLTLLPLLGADITEHLPQTKHSFTRAVPFIVTVTWEEEVIILNLEKKHGHAERLVIWPKIT